MAVFGFVTAANASTDSFGSPTMDADQPEPVVRVTRAPPPRDLSLAEVHGSVPVPVTASFWRKVFAFAGPGYLVAVGYMDPGNWATDIAGGARYGYTLLSVVMLSNLMAILLQAMAARLGIASGRDLAQACRDSYSRPATLVLWVLAETAIAATDLAEVIGAAIALHLLFGLPLAGRRLPHGPRRPDRPLPAAAQVPLRRGAGRAADPRDRRRLCRRPRPVASRDRRGPARVHPVARDRPQPGHALHRDRHPRAPR